MHQLKIFTLCFVSVVCVLSTHVRDARSSASLESRKRDERVNSSDIVAQCNQSFPIKQEFLQDLNTTGSFSDESEKAPMCYIHCYLTKIGVMGEDGQINNEKAAIVYELDDEEMLDDCKKEMASISDPCGMAYFFIRCLMTRTMIDNKNGDEEAAKK